MKNNKIKNLIKYFSPIFALVYMKIISKFKDFYDYKVAKYGVDEKLVYTRKTY